MLDLSWFEAFCITSNHLDVENEGRFCKHIHSCTHIMSAPASNLCCYSSPRSVLLLFGLHHVTETSISESLSEVSVGRHEAVVVEAWPQAGRAKTEGLALGTAGSTQDTLVLGGQVGAKQGLQQLKKGLELLKQATFYVVLCLDRCVVFSVVGFCLVIQ